MNFTVFSNLAPGERFHYVTHPANYENLLMKVGADCDQCRYNAVNIGNGSLVYVHEGRLVCAVKSEVLDHETSFTNECHHGHIKPDKD